MHETRLRILPLQGEIAAQAPHYHRPHLPYTLNIPFLLPPPQQLHELVAYGLAQALSVVSNPFAAMTWAATCTVLNPSGAASSAALASFGNSCRGNT